jgi:hypothetical protein
VANGAEVTLDEFNPSSQLLFNSITPNGMYYGDLVIEVNNIEPGTVLSIYDTDNSGNIISLLFEIKQSGKYHFPIQIINLEGIGIQAENNTLTFGAITIPVIKNIAFYRLDNNQEIALKNYLSKETIHNFGKDYPVYYAGDGSYRTLVSINLQSISFNDGLYQLYCNYKADGVNNLLDPGFNDIEATSPWVDTVLGGEIQYGFDFTGGRGIKLITDGNVLPLLINQPNVTSPNIRYKITYTIHDTNSFVGGPAIQVALGNGLGVLRTESGTFTEELISTSTGDISFIVSPATNIVPDIYFVLDSVSITPLIEESLLSQPLNIKSKHDCTLLITAKESNINDKFPWIYPPDIDYKHYFRIRADLRFPSYFGDVELQSVGRNIVMNKVNMSKRVRLLTEDLAEYQHEILANQLLHSEVIISPPGKRYFPGFDTYSPEYEKGSAEARVSVSLIVNG